MMKLVSVRRLRSLKIEQIFISERLGTFLGGINQIGLLLFLEVIYLRFFRANRAKHGPFYLLLLSIRWDSQDLPILTPMMMGLYQLIVELLLFKFCQLTFLCLVGFFRLY